MSKEASKKQEKRNLWIGWIPAISILIILLFASYLIILMEYGPNGWKMILETIKAAL